MKTIVNFFVLVISVIFISSCQKEPSILIETGSVELQFENFVSSQPLVLGNAYTNSFGEDFKVSKFKYYISNIRFATSSGTTEDVPDTYLLIDEQNAASKINSLSVKAGSYQAISFLIGVDSLRNVSGAQSGALDPALDMFWTWNSGYIMAKLEGSSSFSTLPNSMIEYHIGGFKGADNVLKRVTLQFPSLMEVAKNKSLVVKLNADVNKWFQNPNNLSIAAKPTCTSPGSLARQYSENYANMFSINSVVSH